MERTETVNNIGIQKLDLGFLTVQLWKSISNVNKQPKSAHNINIWFVGLLIGPWHIAEIAATLSKQIYY